ncbi:MAG: tetratricopeptide repeat protein [Bryobacteraceae bacterium]|nr:tetratricopeptide repeat protein [Bryobacteraceae bacterium]
MKLIYRLAIAAALLASMAFAQPKPKSQKEVDALMAIQSAPECTAPGVPNPCGPDARIASVESLLTKFADTEFKSWALFIATASAQQKNDFEKMVIYGERTLEADPKNFQVMIMMASGLASKTREFDLDREEKLGRATKFAQGALDVLKTAAKPNPQLTDELWAAGKKDSEAEAHSALGQIAVVRKKYDVAIQEYKQAVDGAANPDPATVVRLANAYNMSGKPDDAIAMLDKVNTMPEVHPQIKAAAAGERNASVKLKGAGAKPAATPAPSAAPAQVPVK